MKILNLAVLSLVLTVGIGCDRVGSAHVTTYKAPVLITADKDSFVCDSGVVRVEKEGDTYSIDCHMAGGGPVAAKGIRKLTITSLPPLWDKDKEGSQ